MGHIPFPNSEYGVIYADPPWHRPVTKRVSGQYLYPDYNTMSVEGIKALQVPAAADSWLYLWTMDGMLPDALAVMDAWGFTYKKSYIWHKVHVSIGCYNRGLHEQLLLGRKGKPVLPAFSELPESLISVKRGEHSRKPYQFRDMISKLHPGLSKIELFARERFPGWDAWGDELDMEDTLF